MLKRTFEFEQQGNQQRKQKKHKKEESMSTTSKEEAEECNNLNNNTNELLTVGQYMEKWGLLQTWKKENVEEFMKAWIKLRLDDQISRDQFLSNFKNATGKDVVAAMKPEFWKNDFLNSLSPLVKNSLYDDLVEANQEATNTTKLIQVPSTTISWMHMINFFKERGYSFVRNEKTVGCSVFPPVFESLLDEPIVDIESHQRLHSVLTMDLGREAAGSLLLPVLWASPGSGKTYFLRQIQCLCRPNHKWLQKHKQLSLGAEELKFHNFSTKICDLLKGEKIVDLLENHHPIFISFNDLTDYADYVFNEKQERIFRSGEWSLSVRIIWDIFFNAGDRDFSTFLKKFLRNGPVDLEITEILQYIQSILGDVPIVLLVDELLSFPEIENIESDAKNIDSIKRWNAKIQAIKREVVQCIKRLNGNALLRVKVVANVLNFFELEAHFDKRTYDRTFRASGSRVALIPVTRISDSDLNVITSRFQSFFPDFPLDLLKTLLAWSGRHFRTLGFLENVLHALSATERMKPNIQNIFNKWISGWPHPIFIYTVESIRKAMFQEKVAIDSKVSFKRLNDSSLLTMPYSAAIGQFMFLNSLESAYLDPVPAVPQISPIHLIRYLPKRSRDMFLRMDVPNIGVLFERFHFSLYLIWQELGSIPNSPDLSNALFPTSTKIAKIYEFIDGNNMKDLLKNAKKKKIDFPNVFILANYNLFPAIEGFEIRWNTDTSTDKHKVIASVIFHQMKFSKGSSTTVLDLEDICHDLENLETHIDSLTKFLEKKEPTSTVEIRSQLVYWLANRDLANSVPTFAKMTLKPISKTWEQQAEEENISITKHLKTAMDLSQKLCVQVHVVDRDSLKKAYGPFQEWFDVVSKTSPQST